MKLVVFGLTISSSWGNGHATLWRGLVRALAARGCKVVFFERDVSWYAQHRDLAEPPGAELILYSDWDSVRGLAERHVRDADAAMVTSYCPDARAASDLVCERAVQALFYDMDTPVTLSRLEAGEAVDYLPAQGLDAFDLVLSYTGGRALTELKRRLGARRTAPLYGHVDPQTHRPTAPRERFRCALSYLGTFAGDRQATVKTLFAEPAQRRPDLRFVLGGSGYGADFPWSDNIWFMDHVAPPDHAAFFSSSALTLNATRRDMAAMGWCPSGRLFEAAACGTPVLSDAWEGLDSFFTPGREILIANDADDALAALDLGETELAKVGRRARERVLDEHTSSRRAHELLTLLSSRTTGPAAETGLARGL
ncbi:glycosyltransferase [Caulobacter sp. 17J80-11]|uniref:CgeB family protein n=1 Tax=Caulobacter sp. 17J80-11 TaxID=2763502 RepID=UPI001653467B|nr:glycosyltransferase [Caulobacter sp. 17J80-11]MBC6982677.1 glycosyltransferase [Caulobacter sp. 17J80-11]